MRAFIVGFIKGFASVALVLSSIINIFSVGGSTGIIAAIFNAIILISVWLSIKNWASNGSFFYFSRKKHIPLWRES